MILEVDEIHSYYGTSHILQGISLKIDHGEAVCLLGRNGAGKSTTFKSIIGLISPKKGKITFKGKSVAGRHPYQIARLGMAYVPEDRRIYTDLTVKENLEVAFRPAVSDRNKWTMERVFEVFPRLREMQGRKGRQMSGGEQQMLTIARALMGNPELLLLDEPSEGLAPIIVSVLGGLISQINKEGIALFLAEQSSVFALKLVQRAYIIDKGMVEWEGSVQQISENEELRVRYLSI
jgi:branched-chain amino acid transport system ATP-binding protein